MDFPPQPACSSLIICADSTYLHNLRTHILQLLRRLKPNAFVMMWQMKGSCTDRWPVKVVSVRQARNLLETSGGQVQV